LIDQSNISNIASSSSSPIWHRLLLGVHSAMNNMCYLQPSTGKHNRWRLRAPNEEMRSNDQLQFRNRDHSRTNNDACVLSNMGTTRMPAWAGAVQRWEEEKKRE